MPRYAARHQRFEGAGREAARAEIAPHRSAPPRTSRAPCAPCAPAAAPIAWPCRARRRQGSAMSMPDDLPLQTGDVLKGKYRVVRVIGAGGMGAVLEAHHLV